MAMTTEEYKNKYLEYLRLSQTLAAAKAEAQAEMESSPEHRFAALQTERGKTAACTCGWVWIGGPERLERIRRQDYTQFHTRATYRAVEREAEAQSGHAWSIPEKTDP